jgi:hypothetical protein
MSPSDASGNLNPILTDHVQNYTPQDLGWNAIAPVAKTDAIRGQVFGFDKKTQSVKRNTKKGNGEDARTIQMFVGSTEYRLQKHEIHGEVTAEVLEEIKYQGVPINMQLATVLETWDAIRHDTARDVVDLVTTAGNFGTNNKIALTGNDVFGGTTSQLRVIASEAKAIINLNTDRSKVEAVIAYDAFLAAIADPLFLEQFKYTLSPGDLAGDAKAAKDLADFWQVDKVTVSRMKITDPSTGAYSYAGSGCVVFAYVDPTEDLYTKSFAKTYQQKDYPVAKDPYMDDRNGAWYFPVVSYHQPVLTFADAGFLVTGCV